jgi:GT2 family glycosyltransferase
LRSPQRKHPAGTVAEFSTTENSDVGCFHSDLFLPEPMAPHHRFSAYDRQIRRDGALGIWPMAAFAVSAGISGSDGRALRMTVAVVIVTYNSAAVLPGCLGSIPAGTTIVVVDNASTDRSAALAEAHGATVLRQARNLGFGTACNRGAESVPGAHVLFLNPDARLETGALARLQATLETFADAGAVGPLLAGADGRPALRGGSALHDKPTGPPLPLPEGPCCWPLLTGAALLVRRSAFDALGGFDEAIFLYYEDDDFSLRLRQAGWSLLVEPRARVFHEPGHSSPRGFGAVRARETHAAKALLYVTAKHGRPVDRARLRRKTWRRLLQAALLADWRRLAKASAVLSVLRRGEPNL